MKEMNFYLFLTNIAVAVLCGALIPLMPKLTRKSLLFGVRIPLEQSASPEAKNLRNRYALVNVIAAVIILALIVLQYVIFPDATLVAILYFPLLFGVVQMTSFISNWKRAGKLKEERGWKVSGSVFAETKSSHSRGNLSELPWVWYVISLVLIIASVVITLIKYPGLPDRIPTHFGFNMQPDAWADKSLLTVMMTPFFNLVILLIMWLTGAMFVRAKLQIDQQNPALSFTQHRIYRKRMGHGLGAMAMAITVMMMSIGFISLWPDLHIPFWPFLAVLIIPVIALIVVVVLSGQGGFRIKPKVIPSEFTGNPNGQTAPDHDNSRDDDKYWALGMFYHNPDDPKVLVEDRFGTNLGFNYSRRSVKIGVIAALVAAVALYVWATVFLGSIHF